MNKIFEKIENFDTSGMKNAANQTVKTTKLITKLVGDILKSLGILVILFLMGDGTNCFTSETMLTIVFFIALFYFVALIVIRQILFRKKASGTVKYVYSVALYTRLLIIYLLVSTVITTLIAWVGFGKNPILYGVMYLILSFGVEKYYQYWGMIQYNSVVFITMLTVATVINCMLVVVLIPAVLATIGIWLGWKIFIFIMEINSRPDFVIYHSDGSTSHGYFF